MDEVEWAETVVERRAGDSSSTKCCRALSKYLCIICLGAAFMKTSRKSRAPDL